MSIRRYILPLIAVALIPISALAIPMSPKHMADLPAAKQSPATQRYEAGMVALTQKNWRDAEAAFQEASRLDPTSPLPLIGLADVAMQRSW